MRIIDDFTSTNPYFNLAAEEYFLNHSQEHICRFWQNENAVIIGKHQAMPAEVNTKIAAERNIKIGRRISGGGTVYHDLGNLNFTFIANNKNGENLINFKQFTQPIIDAMAALNLEVKHSGRNDLLLDGFKISGNAEHLSQKLKRTLHHGTLLFNSDLSNLGAVLKTPINQFEGKFVQSKRSDVANISNYIQSPMTIASFRNRLIDYFVKHHNATLKHLTQDEILAIENLAQDKYATVEWIMGYSPKFSFNGQLNQSHFKIETEKGIITSIQSEDQRLLSYLQNLNNVYFEYNAIVNALKDQDSTLLQATLSCLFAFNN
jgi:lipoate-protein ligase A